MKKGDRVEIIKLDEAYCSSAKVGMMGTIVEVTDQYYKYWVNVDGMSIDLGFNEDELYLIERGGK